MEKDVDCKIGVSMKPGTRILLIACKVCLDNFSKDSSLIVNYTSVV